MKIFSVLLLSASLAHAAPPAPVKVTSVEGITEYRLGNGLRVLLFPDASKPTLTTNIVYLVGSRHEHYGETGMAHLLEHLLFKPTANFGIKKGSKSPVDILNASGAEFNGTTYYDRTNYHATFPANEENLRTMLALEADRMVNSPVDQNDLWNKQSSKGEMTVVRNEFEASESEPISVTTERLQAVAFDWHNYGKSTIGTLTDIEQVDTARLRAFYKRYYQPDNAVLMVAGRFDEASVLRQINAQFGKIPKPRRVLTPTYTREPVQDGERSVTVRRSGGTQYVGAGYHVAASAHEDTAALALLSRILVDAPGGRLHKALVETKLATSLGADGASTLEPGYRIYSAVVPVAQPLDATQEALLKVLENFKTAPVTEEEVARARSAVIKRIELALNDSAGLTVGLTESLAAGDWRLFFLQRDRIEKVTAAQVQAVAEKYFKASNRTVGRFIPTDTPDRAEIPEVFDSAALLKDYKGRAAVEQGEVFDTSPANIDKRTARKQLPGGMRVALLPKKTKGGTVHLTLQLRMGTQAALRGKSEAGTYATALLLDGSAKFTRQEIKDRFDQLKTRVSLSGGPTGASASLTTTRANLAPALELLAEVLRTPRYPDQEFAEFQREQINSIEQSMPEPQALASNALSRMLDGTPEGDVNHVYTLPEQLARTRAVKVEDVRAFHAAFYGASNATLAAVGDFDAAALKTQLTTLFGDWASKQPYVRIPSVMRAAKAEVQSIETPDKANSMLLAVHPLPLKDDAPDYAALTMANHMLGGGALRSRLADRIRQNEGLSYGIGSQLSVPAEDPAGVWIAYAMSAPQNVAKVEAALREEIARALKQGFTQAELTEARKGWRQGEEVYRTGDGALAGRLAAYLPIERSMAFDARIEAQVAALTVEQVNAALRKHLDPAAISVIKAGDFAKSAKK